MTFPLRGDVFWVKLDPTVGTEIAKTRPALIISNNVGNEYSTRVTVAPITTGGLTRVYPFEVAVRVGEGGLAQAGKIVLDQLRALDKQRLGQRIGTLSAERMEQVNQAIRLSLAV